MEVAVDGISVNPHGHVGDRWVERANRPRGALVTAFQHAEPITAPDVDGDAYLHEPTDTLLVVRDGRLRTVLYANYDQLTTPTVVAD